MDFLRIALAELGNIAERRIFRLSMAPNAARHTREVLWNVQQIVGIEMLCAAQALDFRLAGQEYVQYCEEGKIKKGWRKADGDRPALGRGTHVAYDCIRAVVCHRERDRVLYPDVAQAAALVSSGEIVRAVEEALGPLR